MQKKTILLGRYFISLYAHGLTPLRSQQMSLTLKTSLWTRDDSETFMRYYATSIAIFSISQHALTKCWPTVDSYWKY